MSKRDYSCYDFDKFDYNKKYNLYVDMDTCIFSAAASCAKQPCQVTHKKTGRTKTFENFDAFQKFLDHDDKGKNFTINDFEVPILYFAYGNINAKVDAILDREWIDKVSYYVGGVDNFRKQLDENYKGNRAAKPLLHKYCYSYAVKKYKPIICHGYEAEDHCLADALADENGVISCVDKDLFNQSAFFLNYGYLDMGVFWISPEQAFYNLCIQLMIGDRGTDNIKGIDFVSPELKEKYKVSTKSIGEGTAKKLLEDVKESIPEMKNRLVDVYKLSYGDGWKEALDFTGKLIYITPKRNKIFDVNEFLGDDDNDT